MRQCAAGLWLLLLLTGVSAAADLPTLAGPAMGTTYRVTLAADMPGMTRGEVHREVEAVLARIDRAASTWRDDSDASRFNRAAAGDWVTVSADLMTLVEAAREIHEQSHGGFDITVGPLVRLWGGGPRETGRGPGREPAPEPSADAIAAARSRVGIHGVESRFAAAEAGTALRKSCAGIEIDLSGIAPGYAVDCVGTRLLELGSGAHLVELGGEVRAWGQPTEGRPWRVRLRGIDGGHAPLPEIDLADGMALATSTCRPGRSPLDPRTGRPVALSKSSRTATVRAANCAAADAWAVAAVVLGLEPDEDGTITPPARPAGQHRAGPAGP